MTAKNNILGMMTCMALSAVMFISPAQAFEFGAFGDAKYSTSDDDTDASNSDAFAIGGLDLYAKQDIDDNTEAFIEYVFENDGEGFVLDLERLYVKRKFNDNVQVGMGRFHSPLGYWNNTYHHGVMIQDTVSRPSFLDFEDGAAAILPTHVIGATVEGKVGALGYAFSLANSTFLDTTGSLNASTPGTGLEIGIGNVSDLSDDKTIFARLTYDVSDVKLGLSFMQNSIVEGAVAGGDSSFGAKIQGDEIIDQAVIGLDARYSYDKLNVLAEYFSIDNSAAAGVGDGASHDAAAYYVQLSYQVNDKFRPTYRYESLEFDAATDPTTDAYFNILNTSEYTASVIALRYDLDDTNALTFEYKDTDYEAAAATDVTAMTLDWSFLLF